MSIFKVVAIRGFSATGKRRAFKIMLKSSSKVHLASHTQLYLRLLADRQMSANEEPPIEDTRQTNKDLSTPTTKGITHCAAGLG